MRAEDFIMTREQLQQIRKRFSDAVDPNVTWKEHDHACHVLTVYARRDIQMLLIHVANLERNAAKSEQVTTTFKPTEAKSWPRVVGNTPAPMVGEIPDSQDLPRVYDLDAENQILNGLKQVTPIKQPNQARPEPPELISVLEWALESLKEQEAFEQEQAPKRAPPPLPRKG